MNIIYIHINKRRIKISLNMEGKNKELSLLSKMSNQFYSGTKT